MKEAAHVASEQLSRITDAALLTCGCATPAEAYALIDEVLAIAQQWASGMLPLAEVRRLTTPQERYLAARFTKPQPRELSALLDALIAENPTAPGGYAYATKHGTFTADELRDAHAKMDSVDGDVRIRFPQRQPWLRYPDDEGGDQGERAEPFYAKDQAERVRIAEEFAGDRWMGAKASKRRTIVRRKASDEVQP